MTLELTPLRAIDFQLAEARGEYAALRHFMPHFRRLVWFGRLCAIFNLSVACWLFVRWFGGNGDEWFLFAALANVLIAAATAYHNEVQWHRRRQRCELMPHIIASITHTRALALKCPKLGFDKHQTCEYCSAHTMPACPFERSG